MKRARWRRERRLCAPALRLKRPLHAGARCLPHLNTQDGEQGRCAAPSRPARQHGDGCSARVEDAHSDKARGSRRRRARFFRTGHAQPAVFSSRSLVQLAPPCGGTAVSDGHGSAAPFLPPPVHRRASTHATASHPGPLLSAMSHPFLAAPSPPRPSSLADAPYPPSTMADELGKRKREDGHEGRMSGPAPTPSLSLPPSNHAHFSAQSIHRPGPLQATMDASSSSANSPLHSPTSSSSGHAAAVNGHGKKRGAEKSMRRNIDRYVF